ncbi:hypothetical protein CBW65_23625 [Tumebacillus avium]|uniref:YtkA-like domain-containing protein n=1 Tax=Tumebacillus avium TaxID=1903704 RepID=A0A1Y0IW11_9BACL|nr:hypothetical protein [Tumebacillus avium]ARU63675.1 hypothetical protein CBW65_23625 [Tumebacillus avium]
MLDVLSSNWLKSTMAGLAFATIVTILSSGCGEQIKIDSSPGNTSTVQQDVYASITHKVTGSVATFQISFLGNSINKINSSEKITAEVLKEHSNEKVPVQLAQVSNTEYTAEATLSKGTWNLTLHVQNEGKLTSFSDTFIVE